MKSVPITPDDAVRFFKDYAGQEFTPRMATFWLGFIAGNWNVLVRGKKITPFHLREFIGKNAPR